MVQRMTYDFTVCDLETQALFERARFFSLMKAIAAGSVGRSRRLLVLQERLHDEHTYNRHDVGFRVVPVKRIHGTLNKATDFDCNFYPLHKSMEDRWRQMVMLIRSGYPLPPVELIQVGDDYFVSDGHHRISAARALGQHYVDAHVIRIQV
jgi:hypothetical protein